MAIYDMCYGCSYFDSYDDTEEECYCLLGHDVVFDESGDPDKGCEDYEEETYDWDDDAERCYECTGYGDDYYYDEDLDELVCACDDCPYNGRNQEDD